MEEIVRDVLACATSLIPDERTAAMVFTAGLIASDYAFKAVRLVLPDGC